MSADPRRGTTSCAPPRRSAARAPDADARRDGARARPVAQGRAPPAHRLVQGAGRHEPAQRRSTRRAERGVAGASAGNHADRARLGRCERGRRLRRLQLGAASRSSSIGRGPSAPASTRRPPTRPRAFVRSRTTSPTPAPSSTPSTTRRDRRSGHRRARDPRGRTGVDMVTSRGGGVIAEISDAVVSRGVRASRSSRKGRRRSSAGSRRASRSR